MNYIENSKEDKVVAGKPHLQETSVEDCFEALEAAQQLVDEVFQKFNWEASGLDADALRLLAVVPLQVKKALLGRESAKGASKTITRVEAPARENMANALREIADLLLDEAEHVRGGASIHKRNGETVLLANLVISN